MESCLNEYYTGVQTRVICVLRPHHKLRSTTQCTFVYLAESSAVLVPPLPCAQTCLQLYKHPKRRWDVSTRVRVLCKACALVFTYLPIKKFTAFWAESEFHSSTKREFCSFSKVLQPFLRSCLEKKKKRCTAQQVEFLPEKSVPAMDTSCRRCQGL